MKSILVLSISFLTFVSLASADGLATPTCDMICMTGISDNVPLSWVPASDDQCPAHQKCKLTDKQTCQIKTDIGKLGEGQCSASEDAADWE